MSIFIAGTGTDVGKTILSSLILSKYAKKDDLKYWKPIQTGKISDLSVVSQLTGLNSSFTKSSLYHFIYPASPHYSAYLEREKIDSELLLDEIRKTKNSNYIVEGVGGILVPVTEDELFIDILEASRISVLIVCSTGLGTINHTLLTCEALKKRNIPIVGFFGYGEENELWENNQVTIEKFSGLPSLGNIYVPSEVFDSSLFVEFTERNFDKDEKLRKAMIK